MGSAINRRVADLQAVLQEKHDEVSPLFFVRIICDGCGRDVTVWGPTPEKLAETFDGWYISSTRPYDDRCPECVR